MIVSKFVEPELDFYRSQCNFVNGEIEVFEMRSKGIPLERIAELTGFTVDGVKKISRQVDNKITRVQHFLGTF